MLAKPDLRAVLKWIITRSGSVVTNVITLNHMTPISYLYDQRNGRHQLYLGGFCTIAGLKLFPDNPAVSNIEMYDTEHAESSSLASTTCSALALHLADNFVAIFDFSCAIERDCNFSTHDDGECHFDAGTEELIQVLVERATPPVYNDHLWATLKSNLGCYITVNENMQFVIHPDFDALIEAHNA